MPARRFLVHRRPGRCRAALAMALVWAVATGHAPAREGGVSRAADGRGISVLSPAQVFPVEPAREVPAFELPPDPAEGVATAGGPVMDREGRVAPAPAPVAPSYDWRYDYAGYDPGPPGGVTLVKPIGARLAPLPGRTGLVRETQYWRYRRAGGPTLSVGGVTLDAPAWSSTARLGGVQIADWDDASSDGLLAEGRFGYSSAFGRLDYSDPSARAGDLVFGESAGAGALRYGLTSSLTLESQLQVAPSLTALGLGGRYALGSLGTLQAAAIQSRYAQAEGWRYRLGYSVDLGQGTTLGLSNELTDPHYSDLSRYGSGFPGASEMRNTVTAGLPLGSLGTLSGTYTGLRSDGEPVEHRFGLAHTLSLAPRVNLSLGADRDVVTGDYAMQMQLSLPFDALIHGLGGRR